MRARFIAVDSTDGVTAPSTYQPRPTTATISRHALLTTLLPAVPLDHRAIVAAGAGAGLRWGEAAGLPWGAVDLDRQELRVAQVVIETATGVAIRPYPKSRAGVRTVPLPDVLIRELEVHRDLTIGDAEPDPRWLVFPTHTGTPQQRSNFRRGARRPTRRWWPALNRYTHTPDDHGQRVRAVFESTAAFSLPRDGQPGDQEDEQTTDDGR